MNLVGQSAECEVATDLAQTDQPFACGTACRRTPHDRHAERRLLATPAARSVTLCEQGRMQPLGPVGVHSSGREQCILAVRMARLRARRYLRNVNGAAGIFSGC